MSDNLFIKVESMSALEKMNLEDQIKCLESERDALKAELAMVKTRDGVHHAQLEEARAEISKLKAELEETKKVLHAWEGAHGLDAERNKWKSRAAKYRLALLYVRDNACGLENKAFIDATLTKEAEA